MNRTPPGPPGRTPFLQRDGLVSWPWIEYFMTLRSNLGVGEIDDTHNLDDSFPNPVLIQDSIEKEFSIGENFRDPTTQIQGVALGTVESGHTHPQDLGPTFLIQDGQGKRIDDELKLMLAILDPPRPPQTIGDLGIKVLTATAPVAPDTDFAVAHTLGRIPKGYVVVGRDMATDIYNGVTAWTNVNIYLKSSIGGAAISLFVF